MGVSRRSDAVPSARGARPSALGLRRRALPSLVFSSRRLQRPGASVRGAIGGGRPLGRGTA
eukprot:2647507-Pyramimonas_sp.AAC.1